MIALSIGALKCIQNRTFAWTRCDILSNSEGLSQIFFWASNICIKSEFYIIYSSQIIWPSNRHIILFHTNDKINKFKDLLDIISRRLTINITNDCANSPLYFHLQGIRNSGDIGWIFFSGYRFYMCIEKFGTFPSIFSQFSEMVPNLTAALLMAPVIKFWNKTCISFPSYFHLEGNIEVHSIFQKSLSVFFYKRK